MAANTNECEQCSEIRKMIFERNAVKYHDRSCFLDDNALHKMIDDSRMELFAGNCFPDELGKHCCEEIHYTIISVLRCRGCGKYYYAGYCVRGLPVLKEYSEEDALSFAENMTWGFKGTYFENK